MKITRYHALKILEWCKTEYGRSKYNKGEITLEFKKPDYLSEGELGNYEPIDNTMFVSSVDHPSLEDLSATIIEEYQHYLQSDRMYQKLAKEYDYEDNPYEIQAKYVAHQDHARCLEELYKKYQRFNSSRFDI